MAPKIHVNVTLFGKKVSAGVIKVSTSRPGRPGSAGWAQSQWWGPHRRRTRPREDEQRPR